MEKVFIIGSGFSSLSAACYMAKEGFDVTVVEKHDTIGGRARQLSCDGFLFDRGPTFYWMPDVMENFFGDFGKKSSDYYELIRLDPGYEIYFDRRDSVKLPADFSEIEETFEKYEPGSSHFLNRFLKDAEYNYHVAMDKVVHRPGKSPLELVMPETMTRVLQFVTSLSYTVHRNLKTERLRQILEFPVLFLGAKPSDTPSFYRFMNYADMKLGTWHVRGGMYRMAEGMKKLAEELGVKFLTSAVVEKILVHNRKVNGIRINGQSYPARLVISGADYHHTESLLEEEYRNYSENYWKKRVMAPSGLLFYVGFNKKLKNVSHHTLFFDTDFEQHARKIYDEPGWPTRPLFYASFPSITDPQLAPQGKETAIFLIPVASGLKDNPALKEFYFRQIITRMELLTGQELHNSILTCKSYGPSDFMRDYHAYKGNAYGLSNILLQTAFLKPKVENRRVRNLFYTGQLTVPGPGVPPAIISGKIAAGLATSCLRNKK